MTPSEAPATFELPNLTDDELAALGDDPLLRDAAADKARAAMPAEVQQAVARSAMRGLLARGLLTPAGDGFDLSTATSLILRTRHTPLRLMVVQDIAVDSEPTKPPLIAHGIDGGSDGPTGVLDGFVVDTCLDGVHSFRLTTVTEALDLLALWLLRPTDEISCGTRSLEVLVPGPEGEVTARRWIADVEGDEPEIAAVSPDGAMQRLLSAGQLVAELRDGLEIQ